MFRHISCVLLLGLACPALAASPPASDNQTSTTGQEQPRRMNNEDYGVVTQIDRTMHTITVRKLGGDIVTYDFGTNNLNRDVNVGSTVRITHDQDTMMANNVEPVNLMHDVGVVTKIDESKRTISIRQLGGNVVQYDYGDTQFDASKVKVGERVDIAHEPDSKNAIWLDLADRMPNDMQQNTNQMPGSEQNPSGTNPSGTNPSGTEPSGSNPPTDQGSTGDQGDQGSGSKPEGGTH